MAENILSRYSVEIYTSSGTLVADLTGRASMRKMSVARNRAGSCSFKADLFSLEALARQMNLTVFDLIGLNQNEVRIRRGTRYLFGGQIVYMEPSLDTQEIEVRAVGFLELFNFRHTDVETIYSGVDAGDIAWDLIDTSQSQTNGDFGITLGGIQTSVNRDRTYPAYKNIKDAIIQLSDVINGFDFEFTYDKKFYVYYPHQGIDLTSSMLFNYPGNIKRIRIPRDGTKMFNRAITRGLGFGAQQPIEIRNNTTYQAAYKVRESILDYPDVTETATLDAHGDEQVNQFKDPFEIPQITMDGNQQPYLGSYWLGDRVKIEVTNMDMYKYLKNNTYKIDAIDVEIDNDDVEDITLSLSLDS